MKKYLLLFATLFSTSFLSAQDCSELFFSEYVEGYGQNKAIEIYNPTLSTIDLSIYKVERYSNGSTNSSGGGVTPLSGMLASGDAFVLTNGDTDTSGQFGYCDQALYSLGDMHAGPYPSPMHMNGDDAIVLSKDANIIDVIGRVGEQPSSGAWTDDAASGFQMGAWWTAQHTLIRKRTVLSGDNDGLDLFNPSLEWDSLVIGTWSNLGSHTCNCIDGSVGINNIKEASYVVYPNPANIGEDINIIVNSKIENIEMFSISGKKVLTTTSKRINTEKLSLGTYITLINLSNGEVIENKIIIQ
jgi:hypothetical protein|tara:strand:- start:12910 stop:13809 length:900 start_codon:yes stop_codon:yes gene_type:complete